MGRAGAPRCGPRVALGRRAGTSIFRPTRQTSSQCWNSGPRTPRRRIGTWVRRRLRGGHRLRDPLSWTRLGTWWRRSSEPGTESSPARVRDGDHGGGADGAAHGTDESRRAPGLLANDEEAMEKAFAERSPRTLGPVQPFQEAHPPSAVATLRQRQHAPARARTHRRPVIVRTARYQAVERSGARTTARPASRLGPGVNSRPEQLAAGLRMRPRHRGRDRQRRGSARLFVSAKTIDVPPVQRLPQAGDPLAHPARSAFSPTALLKQWLARGTS